MMGTEEKNTTIGLFLMKISVICILLIISCCNSKRKIYFQEPKLKGYLSNFISSNNRSFRVVVPFNINNVDGVELSHPKDFKINSVSIKNHETIIEIVKLNDNLHQGISISFYNNEMKLIKTQVFFYSNLINISDLNKDEQIIFDKSKDIVPPLFYSDNSSQFGVYKICRDHKISNEFSMLHHLYFLSFSQKSGIYNVCEIDCDNILFEYIID